MLSHFYINIYVRLNGDGTLFYPHFDILLTKVILNIYSFYIRVYIDRERELCK